MKRIALLGSTGSIGQQTLEVVAAQPGRLAVVALAAGGNVALLNEQIRRFGPATVAVQHEGDRAAVAFDGEVLCGPAGLLALAALPEADHCALWGVQTFYRAVSLVNGGRAIEHDLFAGLR